MRSWTRSRRSGRGASCRIARCPSWRRSSARPRSARPASCGSRWPCPTPTSTTRRATRRARCSFARAGIVGPTSLAFSRRGTVLVTPGLLRVRPAIPQPMTPLLVARGLAKSFGARVAVSDLSLELRPGETFALVGPNGAGKTTTLRMLAGLIAPSQGHVELNGRALTPESAGWARRQVGILTEAPGLWDRLTRAAEPHGVRAALRPGLAGRGRGRGAGAVRRAGPRDGPGRPAVEGAAAARRAGADAAARSAGRAARRAHVGPRPRERARRARAGARPGNRRPRRADLHAQPRRGGSPGDARGGAAHAASWPWTRRRRCARGSSAARVRVRLAGDAERSCRPAARRRRGRRARGGRRAVGGARRQPGARPRPSSCGCWWRPARRSRRWGARRRPSSRSTCACWARGSHDRPSCWRCARRRSPTCGSIRACSPRRSSRPPIALAAADLHRDHPARLSPASRLSDSGDFRAHGRALPVAAVDAGPRARRAPCRRSSSSSSWCCWCWRPWRRRCRARRSASSARSRRARWSRCWRRRSRPPSCWARRSSARSCRRRA